jgi:hypothetical protein
MLSDPEAEEIARGRAQGVGGPLVLKWIDQLLADRKERVAQTRYSASGSTRRSGIWTPCLRVKRRRRAVCPKCRKPYVRVSGLSPQGTVYFHSDRSECRSE